MNPYLKAKREQYEALRTTIEGVQTRAAEANRDLTEDELRSVTEQGEQARRLADEIESLTEIENRHAKVSRLHVEVAEDAPGDETRSDNGSVRVGRAYTKDRDPGHYRKDGAHSFFGDLFHSRTLQDDTATRRLVEHARALDMAGEGPGVIPPVWMAQEFQETARWSRKLASAVRNIAITSAAPISMPKATTAAPGLLTADQSAEGANNAGWFTDRFDSAVDTVSPVATAGGQDVSRQMLDSSNPAVDALIWSDLIGDYNEKTEARVAAALVASATTAAGHTYASEATNYTATDPEKAAEILQVTAEMYAARKAPAQAIVTSITRWASMLAWADGTGRPLMPALGEQRVNAFGGGDVAGDGVLAGVPVLATPGIVAYPDYIIAARLSDVVLFESPVLRFRYEEVNGPSAVRLGVWAYQAAYVKYAGASAHAVEITAA